MQPLLYCPRQEHLGVLRSGMDYPRRRASFESLVSASVSSGTRCGGLELALASSAVFFAASFALPQAFWTLPSACFAAPFTCMFGSFVHSPAWRSTRPATSFAFPSTRSLFILHSPLSY